MTADELVSALARCRRRIKVLRDDNQRLWESREQWKRKHAQARSEIQVLRQRVRRLDATRRQLRAQLAGVRNRRPSPWANTTLTRQDIQRILAMPPRD